MKILYLNPAGNVGGAERVLIDTLASLRQSHPEWHLEVVAAAQGALTQEVEALGVKARMIAFPRSLAMLGDAAAGGPAGNGLGQLALAARFVSALPGAMVYTRRLGEAIKESAPDLIHTNGLKMHVLGARAAPTQIPMIWHVHDFVSVRPLMSRLLRVHARRCANAIAVSCSVAADVRSVLGAKVPITTVHNAIDLQRFTALGARLDLDQLAGLPLADIGIIRVGLVATMARWKGHEVFLRAIAELPHGLFLRAYVIGGPQYETGGSETSVPELQRLTTSLGLQDRVGFTGFIADVPAALRALDIVVHASTEPEPFGLVIAEAMACGRAVIVSAAGGADEMVTDGLDALTYRPGDTAALARLIAMLASDSALRQKLGDGALLSASRSFGRERLAREIAPVYARALERGH
ncbi:MAG TPA: glycosyltransferase [Candidatus Binataceae bacterium]|nr:glycosyltransferase [Candidatus Binataceae bacterium]